MMRCSLLLIIVALLLTACATEHVQLERGMFSPDTILIKPVKNLAGVSLKVPEIYLGDAGGEVAGMDVEDIDVVLLAEAAVYAHLDELGYRSELDTGESRFTGGPKYELHCGVTVFDMTELRQTGRIRMAMTVMLVDRQAQREVSRGSADREFQLMDIAPDEAGAIGEQRFIAARLQIFTESLARDAVDDAGF